MIQHFRLIRRVPRGILCAAILPFCLIFSACNKKNASASQGSQDYANENSLTTKSGNDDDDFAYANEEAVKRAFTLDYRAESPEAEQPPETLDAALRAAQGLTGKNSGTVEVIPGLRKLSDYKTNYVTGHAARMQAEKETKTETFRLTPPRNAGPLTVVDWGPQNFLSSAVQRPSIFVIFSQPMVPLAALGAASGTSPVVSIEPPLKGAFRWYGTSFLSFESAGPCMSQQTYTINVSPAARSLYGMEIEGQTRFSFETERLSIKSLEAGVEFRRQTGFRFSKENVPPLAAKQLTAVFNYPVRADDIENYISVSSGKGGAKRFTLSQLTENSLLISLLDDVEFDTKVTVTLKKGARSGGGNLGTAEDQEFSFKTPASFVMMNAETLPAWGKYRNVFNIEFSAPLEAVSALKALRTEPAMPLTDENIEIWNDNIRISNLPVGFSETFKIIIDANLTDIYGRRLDKNYEAALTSRPEPLPSGSVNFLDWGFNMLEAQFEPRFLFEYKNIAEGSFYKIEQRNNPYSDTALKTGTVELTGFKKNHTYFEEMNLRPYLNSEGKGFVSFDASIKLLEREIDAGTGKQKTREETNWVSIQVTDLGITARTAFNKAAVMVTSLSTGQPVEGAAVKLIAPALIKSNADISAVESMAEAVTDKNGLAVLNMAAGVLREALKDSNSWLDAPYVLAEKDGDRAVFLPDSHNAWSFDVYSSSARLAERAAPVTFMFSDRGIYKPGETITFRGVDRSLLLGMYTIYNGDYTVRLVKEGYKGEEIASLDGAVSASGSFYGSIKLSDDLTPGEYRLEYIRSGSKTAYAGIPVTVAYFERLKFQASITAPSEDIISGGDINAELQASYLSGGNLSDAGWNASWYRVQTRFNPDTLETRGFTFGPRGMGDWRRFMSSSSGSLSADGKAVLSQKTG
ncbi:MAG: hypothetical protein LBH18_06430, partial [Spirochaetaceae bacterium]|nr:hypothetical protein [Spirochaetaceae bacterium]